MNRRLTLSAATLLLAAVMATPALADDRPPTADERARIEAALKAEGYTSWSSIELDDDKTWEVDDAIDAEGREWDLDLDVQSLNVIKRDD